MARNKELSDLKPKTGFLVADDQVNQLTHGQMLAFLQNYIASYFPPEDKKKISLKDLSEEKSFTLTYPPETNIKPITIKLENDKNKDKDHQDRYSVSCRSDDRATIAEMAKALYEMPPPGPKKTAFQSPTERGTINIWVEGRKLGHTFILNDDQKAVIDKAHKANPTSVPHYSEMQNVTPSPFKMTPKPR